VLKGSRVTVAIETEQPLLRTNSPHHDGNRVTLLDVDVEGVLFSRQVAMLANTPASFDDLLWAFADVPGVTVAREHDVTLEFRDPAARVSAPGVPAPPDTEILLAPLTNVAGKLTVGMPVNISRSTAHDDQPSFTPDGRTILFSSSRRGAIDTGTPGTMRPPSQTDIYRYDIAATRVSRVTRTPESEYSPVLTPDGAHISVVRLETDGAQRLWSFTAEGQNPVVLLADVNGVGSHVWIDDRTVALFVWGRGADPATLQVADTRTGTVRVVAAGIGRSVQRMPSGQISFVQLQPIAGAAPVPAISRLDAAREAAATSTVTRAVAGATDPYVAWMPDGTLLAVHLGKLYRWHARDPVWTAVADLEALGLHDVTGLTVSPAGDRLALVAQLK
jgi:hypothetical protein